MVPGKKMKNEAVRNKMKKKQKEEKGKGNFYSREKYYGCGKAGKGLLGEKK